MTLSPLRRFVLSALLWLPACFLLWFAFDGAVVWPVAQVTGWLLPTLLPQAIGELTQLGALLEVDTRLMTPADEAGRVGLLVLEIRPLIYAWCLPLFAGLVMATPLERRERVIELAIGLPVLWLVVCWGTVFDVLKVLAFDAGPLGVAAIERAGFSADAVALGYQFGYLILPAVMPVALWVLLNRAFLEELVGWAREPNATVAGPSPPESSVSDREPMQ
jgi:hypothetical protein